MPPKRGIQVRFLTAGPSIKTMTYADALADLKADFGKKKVLTPEDIAPYIGKSPAAQAALRSRKAFPIPSKELGGRIVISIYDLARFISDDDGEAPPSAAKQAVTMSDTKAKGRSSAGKADTSKPFRRAPSLGRTLVGFRKQLDQQELELKFKQVLFAHLEAIVLDSTAKRVRAPKRKTL